MKLASPVENNARIGSRSRFSRLGILEEPVGYVDGTNLYDYVKNDPIDHLDPLGLATTSPATQKSVLKEITYDEQPFFSTGWGLDYSVTVKGDLPAKTVYIQTIITKTKIVKPDRTVIEDSERTVKEIAPMVSATGDTITYGNLLKGTIGKDACHVETTRTFSTSIYAGGTVTVKNLKTGEVKTENYDKDRHGGGAGKMSMQLDTLTMVIRGTTMSQPFNKTTTDPNWEMEELTGVGNSLLSFGHVDTLSYDVRDQKPVNIVGEVTWKTGNAEWDKNLHRTVNTASDKGPLKFPA